MHGEDWIYENYAKLPRLCGLRLSSSSETWDIGTFATWSLPVSVHGKKKAYLASFKTDNFHAGTSFLKIIN